MLASLRASDLHFRPMHLDDVDEVARIEELAYQFPWTRTIFRDCLRAQYSCWIWACSAEILGYGILSVAAAEAHVLNIVVKPDQQGQGHGRQIVEKLIALARSHQAQRIYLEVRPSNQRAIALYDALGFNEIGRRPNYYPAKRGREDAVVMAMELIPDTGL
jgi:ribosomal-protein-alanine N-acetyltransferase